MALLSLVSCKSNITLDKVTTLSQYPSGSALAFINNHIYLAGDDMSYLLVIDTSLKELDSIPFVDSQQGRMPKPVKPDIESAIAASDGTLVLIGSGSLDPYRSNAWLINVADKGKTKIDLQPFYNRLRSAGIKTLNIEGAAEMPGTVMLSNRGNKAIPENHLIFTSPEFWKNQQNAEINIVKIGTDKNAVDFNGVSGLEYSALSDCLVMTVSTENTYNSYTDGAIGKSYLWIVNGISGKKKMSVIDPDVIFDLEAIDKRFLGQKIESVCIISETPSELQLVLAADNDAANTVLFKLTVRK
jgi:hypothetical protein